MWIGYPNENLDKLTIDMSSDSTGSIIEMNPTNITINKPILNDVSITENNQLATKAYVDSHSGGTGLKINEIATNYPTGADWSNNNHKITLVTDPTNA